MKRIYGLVFGLFVMAILLCGTANAQAKGALPLNNADGWNDAYWPEDWPIINVSTLVEDIYPIIWVVSAEIEPDIWESYVRGDRDAHPNEWFNIEPGMWVFFWPDDKVILKKQIIEDYLLGYT